MSPQTSSTRRADVTTTVRHGVPHVVVPAPGPVRARLLFRVGVADEAVPQRGLTHLVEHLLMRALGPRTIEVNAHTGPWTTGFEAVGPAAEVTRFLEDVWAAVAAMSTDGLDLERRVLRHESAGASSTPALESLRHRAGFTGAALMWTDELGLPAATEEVVRAWARRHLVRGGAALAATADLAPDLSADLGPDAPPAALPATALVRGDRGPVWVGDTGGTAVSLLLPTAGGLDLAVGRLLVEAATRTVRHGRALAYEVGLDCLPVSHDLTEVALFAACDPEEHPEVAELLVGVLRRFRDAGPEPADLDLERRRTHLVWTETTEELAVASEAAEQLLLGRAPRTLAERVLDNEALDADAVRAAVREAWPTVQVLVPADVDPGIEGVRECRHDGPSLSGRVHRGHPLALVLGARVPLPSGASLVRGEEGLSLRLDGETTTVRWDDVVAVVRQPHALTVLGRDGSSVLLPDGTFWGGRALRRDVEARVDPALVVDVEQPLTP